METHISHFTDNKDHKMMFPYAFDVIKDFRGVFLHLIFFFFLRFIYKGNFKLVINL